jgi:hypothetical protein
MVIFRLFGFCQEEEAGPMKDDALCKHLVELLKGGSAHMSVEEALRELPTWLAGSAVPGFANTPWRLLEHIRIAQWDILEFSRNAQHVSPEFPVGYWPQADTASPQEWVGSIDAVCNDLQAMIDLVEDPTTDLFAKIPHGTGQTVLREAMLIADHNSYHLGQLMTLRKRLEQAEVQ